MSSLMIFYVLFDRCEFCGKFFQHVENFINHVKNSHRAPERKFVKINTFKPGRYSSKRKYSKIDGADKNSLFHQLKNQKKEIAKNQTAFTEYIVSVFIFYVYFCLR